MKASAVQEDIVKLDVRELLGDLLTGVQKQTVGEFHNVGLVNGCDALPANLLGVGKRVAGTSLRGILSDKLDGLHDAVDNLIGKGDDRGVNDGNY